MAKPQPLHHQLPADPRAPARSSTFVLAALSLTVLLASLGASSANAGLPVLAHAFGAPFAAVQWVVLAYLLASTAAVVVAGRIGDLAGGKRTLLAGVALFTAASAVAGLVSALGALLIARAMQGLGAAAMLAMATSLATAAVPRAQAGRALGMMGAMSAVGTALGPSLGGALIAVSGWRGIFLVNVPLGLAALALAQRGLPADTPRPTDTRPGFDGAGTGLLVLTLVAYALAVTPGPGRAGWPHASLLAAAVLGTGWFVRIEARTAAPLVRLELLRDPRRRAGLVTSLLVAAVLMATLVVGPFHFSRALGLGAAATGLALSMGPLVAALTGWPAGRLVDRAGASGVALGGLAALAAGCAAVVVMPAGWGLVGYLTAMAVVTAGYALFQTANNTAVLAEVDPGQRGVVSGLLNLSRNLGLITGASVLGAVFAGAASTGDVATAGPAAVFAGVRWTFGVATGFVIVAFAVAWNTRAGEPTTGVTPAAAAARA